MTLWQYLIVVFRHEDVLNGLGGDGWELVAALNTNDPAFVRGIFKRPLPATPPEDGKR